MKIVLLTSAFVFLLASTAAAQVLQIPSFTLSSQSVRQGDVLIVTLSSYSYGFRAPRTVIRVFDGDFEPNNRGVLYIGIDPETKPGKYKICLVEGHIYWYCTEVNVLDRKFQEVKVRRRKTVRNIPHRANEAVAINNAYKRGDIYQSYADGPYVEPLDLIFETQEFYRKVIFTDGLSLHNGVDLRASVGTSVKAVNSGKVVLTARSFSLEGNMVILDHGSGVFSLYLHLSRVDVREGQMVKGGDVVGLAGDTGLGVTGPHLHFAVKVRGANVFNPNSGLVNVDPLGFIDTMSQLSTGGK